MRDASQILSFKILFLVVFLASLCLAPAIAQKRPEPTSPKYDLHTETKMKVTVEELKLPPKGSEKEVAHLLGKSGADSVDVYLCPKSFLDDMGVNFREGRRNRSHRVEGQTGYSRSRPGTRSGERKRYAGAPR